MSFELFLETIRDPASDLSMSEFHEVSDLSPEELGQFAKSWLPLPPERQREIVATMVELAEQNAELDFTAVFKLCLKVSDEEILEIAIDGLWEHEDRSIIAGLVGVLSSDKNSKVRAAAALALGKFPVLAQEGKLLAKDGELIHQSLMGVLDDEDEEMDVRRRCLESVAPFNTDAIQQFVEWAYTSEDQDLKSSSIFAMGRTGETRWLPTLIRELESSDPIVRYETAHACGELGEEDAILHLIPLLQDDDHQVQLASIAALGKIGGGLAKRVLVNCVKEGDAALEDAAKAELENIELMEDPLGFSSQV
jgi:HEAT repeat protein